LHPVVCSADIVNSSRTYFFGISITCTRKAISTTNVVIIPITRPNTPLATVEEPISTSI